VYTLLIVTIIVLAVITYLIGRGTILGAAQDKMTEKNARDFITPEMEEPTPGQPDPLTWLNENVDPANTPAVDPRGNFPPPT